MFDELADLVIAQRKRETGLWKQFKTDTPDALIRSNIKAFLAVTIGVKAGGLVCEVNVFTCTIRFIGIKGPGPVHTILAHGIFQNPAQFGGICPSMIVENTVLHNSVPTLLVMSNGTGAAIQGSTRPGADGSGVVGYSDGDGNGVQGSVNGSGNAIQGTVTNNFARAAYFKSTSSGNTKAAVHIESNGAATSKALRVISTGTGDAGYFEIQNSRSDGEAVEAHTNGTGNAVAAVHTGSIGRAGYFLHEGTSNAFPGVEVLTRGEGRAAHVEIDNSANGSAAVYAKTNGNGPAVDAVTFGGGPAAQLAVMNATSSNNALFVQTIGTGRAALFQANNVATTVPAVQISTQGSGPALHVTGNVEVNGNIDMGYEIVTNEECNSLGSDVVCPSGKRVLGGGCSSTSTEILRGSSPLGSTGWHCGYDGFICVTAYAICANIR